MREIIHIGLGTCGARIGVKLFEQLANEYQIENNRICEKPIDGIEAYFSEIGEKKYVPRSILQSREIDSILAQPIGILFNPNNYQEDCYQSLRKELEICNNCQAIQITHHLSTDLKVLEEMQDLMEKKYIQSFFILPSDVENTIEVVKSTTNLNKMKEYNCYAFDNQSLNEIHTKTYKSLITFNDYNTTISTIISGITCPMRYQSTLNLNFDKLYYDNPSKLNIDVCTFYQDKSNVMPINQYSSSVPLIQFDAQVNHKSLAQTILIKSQNLQPFNFYNKISHLSKNFYNDIPNLQFTITPSKVEQVIQLLKSTHIKTHLEQLINQTTQFKQKGKKNKFYQIFEQDPEINIERAQELLGLCDEIINTHTDNQQDNQIQESGYQEENMSQKQQFESERNISEQRKINSLNRIPESQQRSPLQLNELSRSRQQDDEIK